MYQPQTFQLKNGVMVQMRQIAPTDKALISAGFERLSKETIRHRFMGLRKGFSEDELRFLTEIDGVDHFAIGVASLDGREGIAVGRYVRDKQHMDQAELALIIVDAYQRLGLGGKLLNDLAEHALKQGIQRFVGMVDSQNTGMIALTKKFPGAKIIDGQFSFNLPALS